MMRTSAGTSTSTTRLLLALTFCTALLPRLARAQIPAWEIRDDATGGDCPRFAGNWNAGTSTCTLTADVTAFLTIVHDGVTLDGAGRAVITGGIATLNASGVKILNVRILQPMLGIRQRGDGKGHTIANNVIIGTAGPNNNNPMFQVGIETLGTNSVIRNNKVSGFMQGIRCRDECTVDTNEVFDNVVGISTGSASSVTSNTVHDNSQTGIRLPHVSGTTVSSNRVSNSETGIGIYLDSRSNAVLFNVVSNTRGNVGDAGINIAHSHENSVFCNDVSNATPFGARIWGGTGNVVFLNNFLGNVDAGVFLVPPNANDWDLPKPDGGSYWGRFSPGCGNLRDPTYCDNPYVFRGGQDDLPRKQQILWQAGACEEVSASKPRLPPPPPPPQPSPPPPPQQQKTPQ